MKLTAIALLSTGLVLQTQADVQLLPAGEFKGLDGRPGKGLTWKLSDERGRAIAAHLNARHGASVLFSLDYEHQALMVEKNGQPAPASGWASKFEWRDGQGLWALNVQWTDRARQMIEAGEYRYLSPALIYDKRTGEVTDLVNASLTNLPNLEALSPLAHERLARLNAEFSNDPEISDMNPLLQALLAALNIPETATPEQGTAAVATLRQAATDRTALLKSLGLADDAQVATATTAIATLRTKADAQPGGGEPDPTKWVSLERFNQLNTEVAALRNSQTDREVDELIAQATRDGKCAGVVAETWRDVGKKDIAMLRQLIEKTPANPALAGQQQTGGKPPAGGGSGDALDASELAVCRQLGLDPKDYLATRKELEEAQA